MRGQKGSPKGGCTRIRPFSKVGPQRKVANAVFTEYGSSLSSIGDVSALLNDDAPGRPEEVVRRLKVRADRVDLVDEVLHAVDAAPRRAAVRAKNRSRKAVADSST